MAMDLTSLKPEPVTTLDLTANANPLVTSSPMAVQQKATKYAIALGDKSPDISELKTAIQSGTESNIRQNAVAEDYFQRRDNTKNMVAAALQSGVNGSQAGDAEFIQALGTVQPMDPDTVLEEKLGEKIVNITRAMDDNEDRTFEEDQNPVGAESLTRVAQDLAAKKMIAFDLNDKYREKTKAMGWGEYLFDTGLQLLPIVQWHNFTDSSLSFVGTAIEKRVDELYRLSPSEFKVELQAELDRLEALNPLDAEKFAAAVTMYGSSEKDLDNIFTGADAAGVIPLGAISRLSNTARTLRATAKASIQKELTVPDVLANTGNIAEAADISALEAAANLYAPKAAGTDTIKDIAGLLQITPSLYNPKYFVTNAGAATAVRAGRIVDLMAENISNLSKAVKTSLRPVTLTDDALQAAYEAAREAFLKTYTGVSDNVLTVSRVLPEASETNTPKLVVTIGQDGGSKLFDKLKDAQQAAKNKYKLTDYVIVEDAGKYAIQQTIDVADNSPEALSKLMTTENRSHANNYTYLKSLMGAKEQVSTFQAEQRAAASHMATRYGDLVVKVARPVFEKLSNKAKADLDVIMAVNRDSERIPGKPDTRGMFYDNLGELQDAYMKHLGRMPTEADEAAYFTVRQLSDFDYYLRAVSRKKAKIRMGYSEHTLALWDPNTKSYKEATFDAKFIDDLPFNSRDDANVLVLIDKDMHGTTRLSQFTPENKSQFKKLKEQGYKVIQVLDPNDKSLNNVLPIQFIIAKNSKVSSLKLDKQVGYRPGFHVEYQADYYIAQPRMSQNRGRKAYLGDDTLLSVSNSVKGKDELARLEKARQLYVAKDWKALDAYLSEHLPWNRKQFAAIFKRFNPETPFFLVKNGHNVSHGSSLSNTGKTLSDEFGQMDNLIDSPFNDSAKLNNEFIGEKGTMLKQIEETGTQADPVYRLQNADMYSPLNTQIRAMGRVIRNQAFEDYQFGAVNSFIEEFANIPGKGSVFSFGKNTVSLEQLRRNPIFYFKHATIEHPDKRVQTAARRIKAAIEALVGEPSQYQRALDNFREDLMNTAYKVGGDKGTKYVPTKVSSWITDPAQHARTMVADIKLGMFNPVQTIVQGATFGNIIAISPIHGLAQTPVTLAMKYMLNNPLHVDWYAQRIAKAYDHLTPVKYRWTADKIKESLEGYNRSGLGLIGGEYAWRNDISDPKFFKGKARRFLDKSYVFFNHTESLVRMASWNTAYSEYLANIPGKTVGKLTDSDFRKILAKAQDYSANMTRDNNAFWQRGLTGSFTQFFAYTARVLELLVGNRLTLPQKVRLGVGISALYGFPPLAGLGISLETGDPQALLTSLNPFDEDLRTYALENGINLDETTWGMINNGLASMALHGITGQHMDVAQRIAPYSVQIGDNFKDNFRNDNPYVATIVTALGASGSIIRDIVTSTGPIVRDMYQVIGQGESTELLIDDFFNAFREISTVNNAYKAYVAYNALPYLSKRGTLLSDGGRTEEEKLNLLFESVAGIQTYDQTDLFRTFAVRDSDKSAETFVRKEMSRYGTMYLEAIQRGDTAAQRQYRNHMEALLNGSTFNEREKARVFIQSLTKNSLGTAVWKSFAKDNPAREKLIQERGLDQ